jgi:small subunit ribosomal protein S8
MSYPVTDFLIRIKNGYLAGRKTISSPSSKMRVSLAELMKRYGYITNYSIDETGNKVINVQLSYEGKIPNFTDLKIFSKPGRRLYEKASTIPWGKTPKSLIIISTSKGLMSQKEAVVKGLGGEIIAEIY